MSLPPALRTRLAAGGSAAGWAAFREQVAELRRTPGVLRVAVMTLPMDPDESYAKELAAALA